MPVKDAKFRILAEDKTGTALKSASSNFGELKTSAVGALAAIGLSAAGTIAAIKGVVDEGDRIQQFSTRLGASTEALSEMRLVAAKSTIDINALTVGWQRMTRRVAEAAEGMGEAQGVLKELNLDAEELNRMRPEDQFEAIAEELSKVENQSDKVRLAFKLFDTEGVGLLQTMTEGAEGIRKVRQEAREMGLSLSGENAAALSEFSGEIATLNLGFKAMLEQLSLGLLPLMRDLGLIVKENLDLFKASAVVIEGGVGLMAAFAGAFTLAAEGVLYFLTPFSALTDSLHITNGALDSNIKKLNDMHAATLRLGEPVAEMLGLLERDIIINPSVEVEPALSQAGDLRASIENEFNSPVIDITPSLESDSVLAEGAALKSQLQAQFASPIVQPVAVEQAGHGAPTVQGVGFTLSGGFRRTADFTQLGAEELARITSINNGGLSLGRSGNINGSTRQNFSGNGSELSLGPNGGTVVQNITIPNVDPVRVKSEIRKVGSRSYTNFPGGGV